MYAENVHDGNSNLGTVYKQHSFCSLNQKL